MPQRAPVNGQPYGTISWDEHVKAWGVYRVRWSGQSAETIAARGGFSIEELILALGRMPETWEPNRATKFWKDY
jgi:hypothetical protein